MVRANRSAGELVRDSAFLEPEQCPFNAGAVEKQASAPSHPYMRDDFMLDQRAKCSFTDWHETAQLLEVKEAAGEICAGRGRLARVLLLLVRCSIHPATKTHDFGGKIGVGILQHLVFFRIFEVRREILGKNWRSRVFLKFFSVGGRCKTAPFSSKLFSAFSKCFTERFLVSLMLRYQTVQLLLCLWPTVKLMAFKNFASTSL